MNDSVLIESARDFAINAHGSQMYGDEPYSIHLSQVAKVLEDLRLNSPFHIKGYHIAAAWLHDSVEDTEVKIRDIEYKFGSKVSDIVFAVTNEVGRNRVEKTLKTLHKVRTAGRAATIVKLADRISNLRFSIGQTGRHYRMYQREHPIFEWALRKDVHGIQPMWDTLNELVERGKE